MLRVERLYAVFETPAGWMAAAFTEKGLCALTLPVPIREQAESHLLGKGMPLVHVETNEQIAGLADDLRRYLAGERVSFGVRLDLSDVTDWQRRVLMRCAEIPYGVLITYGELAEAAGSPGAARAVGQAMARNPVPIVVPCHRVVAACGKLGGFTAGLEWKRRLLRIERVEGF